MAEHTKKMGRPKLGPEQKLTGSLAFRPKKAVREYLDQQVESGEATTIGAAINDAIERSMMSKKEATTQMSRVFGGESELALGFLVSRIANYIAHRRKKHWHEDPEVLFQTVAAFVSITHWMMPRGWGLGRRDEARVENVDAALFAETEQCIRECFEHPEEPWWPLGQGALDNHLLPMTDMIKWLAARIYHDRLSRLDDPFFAANQTVIWRQVIHALSDRGPVYEEAQKRAARMGVSLSPHEDLRDYWNKFIKEFAEEGQTADSEAKEGTKKDRIESESDRESAEIILLNEHRRYLKKHPELRQIL